MIAALLAAGEGFEAPTWWRGEVYELILGSFASILVFGALFKFAGPAMRKAMTDRTARIQADFDKAAAARTAAETDAAGIRANLTNADAESAAIVAEAAAAAERMKAESAVRLEAELADLRTKTSADLESLRTRSASEVSGSVATLAIGAAERVVERNLDHDTQVALIDNFIEQVGAMHV